MTTEHDRLHHEGARWKRWGPYVSERAWGTVREDYSPNGTAWDFFPHDHARSRAYRWNEDGLAGICDDQQRLCFALALWNERDLILKERLFGVNGNEGNHGEDVKEYYFYLDATPSHSWLQMLYKYPQRSFPYADLINTNHQRGRLAPEYELIDTGIFAENRYFDVLVTYAQNAPGDILIKISATNRGPVAAPLHLLPTLWFRNTWSWGARGEQGAERPLLSLIDDDTILAEHPTLGRYALICEAQNSTVNIHYPFLLFTENDTNTERLFNYPNKTPYVKDAFHRYLINGDHGAINPAQRGTKAAAHYHAVLQAGETWELRLRLTADDQALTSATGAHADRRSLIVAGHFDAILAKRKAEADVFHASLQPAGLSDDERLVQRQALAGMIWSKQFYHFDINRWLEGDPGQPAPPAQRKHGRNREWLHLNNADILSMPDKWEYPWYAAWDLAFHCLPLAILDPTFAKEQLILLGREWYQHPNGQIPAYEWNFSDVNPPVMAWAAWRVYKIDQRRSGQGDREFLERVFHKLLLNFTWWVNRKDEEGNNVFQGGFLGLDNIGVFDRSQPLPTGGSLEQSDGTAWMGMFCLNMLTIALELACYNRVYEDIATKFFEHFLYIAHAMNNIAGQGVALWDEEDQFFYDVLLIDKHKTAFPLKIRSMVGLIPLFAVTTIEPELLEKLPEFRTRLEWFINDRPDLAALISRWEKPGLGARRLLALCRGSRMKRVLKRMLDPDEFLSPYGIRALSRHYADHPYRLEVAGAHYEVRYLPAESDSGLFGGNSNWRGPVWFPVNYLLIESLQQFHHYYGDDFLIECPTGSGQFITLQQIADLLSQRLINIFTRDDQGRRAVFSENSYFQNDPHWRDLIPFYEYFHGDNGAGLGASHQTGWTGLVAKLIQQQGMRG